jgi:hypothetical protein
VVRRIRFPDITSMNATGEPTMYDMYPEWGPSRHRDESPDGPVQALAGVQTGLDLRDNGGQRPDDN